MLVQVTQLCESFHCLPQSGGLYDQDCVLVQAMHIVLAREGAKTEEQYKQLQDQIAKANASRH